jgi:hypothetical protein
MRTAITALIAIVLLGGAATADGADADPRCLTKREARVLWPNKHLYWTLDGSRRCWGDRRGGRARLLVTPKPQQAHPMPPRPVLQEAEPLPNIPAEMVPAVPPPFDENWLRQFEERLSALSKPPREETVYSTFAGPPPDVWPEAKPARRVHVGLWAMMATALFAFIAGMVSQRWDAP